MKLLFLDIDGVLNCDRSFDDYIEARKRGERLARCQSYYFAPWSVAALNRITDETGARIVISSSWRDVMEVVYERFAHFGITGTIIGRTPLGINRLESGLFVAGYKNRGAEIDAFLRDYARRQFERKRFWRADYVSHYVILDDDNVDYGDDTKPHQPFFIRTDFEMDGLTDTHATRGIALLNDPVEIGTIHCSAPTQMMLKQKHIQGILNGTPFPYGMENGETPHDAVSRLRSQQKRHFCLGDVTRYEKSDGGFISPTRPSGR